MISYFQDGINDIIPRKQIDIAQLVKIIRDNPLRDKIEHIRLLRLNGDEVYRKLKKQLPYVTPHCKVKVRNLNKETGGLEKNLVSFSNYIYCDIDGMSDVDQYKKYFIERYGQFALLVCKSCSCGGLTVLFRITNEITIENFDVIYYNLISTVLKDEKVDPNAEGIGRAMFISSDPDVWFNYDNEVELDLSNNDATEIKKEVNQSNSYGVYINTLVSPFSRISFNQILEHVRFETTVNVENPVLDFKPINYVKVFVPKVIQDGTKHQYYTRYIHSLVYLNPEIEKDYILSYLFYVNSNFARPGMDPKELIRLFLSVYNGITNTGLIHVKTRIKNVHFNPSCGLGNSKRSQIANFLNGAHRRSITIDKIQDAIQSIVQMGNKITQKEVARVSGLNVKTVRTHFDAERIDVQQIVRDLNSDDNFIYDEPAEDNQLNFNDLCYSIGKRSMFNLFEMIETTRSTQNEDDNLFHIEFGTGELRRSG
jgi:hypothetical protein